MLETREKPVLERGPEEIPGLLAFPEIRETLEPLPETLPETPRGPRTSQDFPGRRVSSRAKHL